MVLDLILNGLVQGCLLALICIGYSLAYGTAKVINFAHADVMIVGGGYLVLLWSRGMPTTSNAAVLMSLLFAPAAYLALLTWLPKGKPYRHLITGAIALATFTITYLLAGKLPFLLAVILAIPWCAALSTAIFRGVYLPLQSRNAPRTSILLAALGMSIALESYLLVAWGSQYRFYAFDTLPQWMNPQNVTAKTSEWSSAFQYGIVRLPANHIVATLDLATVLLFLITVSSLAAFFRFSRAADAIIASADAPMAARACGIRVEESLGLAFFLGGAIASLGGTLYVLRSKALYPTAGFSPGILAFAACVLGGIGSLRGAVAGALLTGLITSLAPAIPMSAWARACLPSNVLQYMPSLDLSNWSYGVVYVLMILVILFKPEGLFKR